MDARGGTQAKQADRQAGRGLHKSVSGGGGKEEGCLLHSGIEGEREKKRRDVV